MHLEELQNSPNMVLEACVIEDLIKISEQELGVSEFVEIFKHILAPPPHLEYKRTPNLSRLADNSTALHSQLPNIIALYYCT